MIDTIVAAAPATANPSAFEAALRAQQPATPNPAGQDTPPAQPGQDSQPKDIPPPAQGEDPSKPPEEKTEAKRERDRVRYDQMHARWKTAEAQLKSGQDEITALRQQIASMRPIDPNVDPHGSIAQTAARAVQEAQLATSQGRLQASQAAAATAMADTWNAKVDAARATIPDFDQVVTDHTPIHAYAAPLIADSEVGPQVAYWLGKNPAAAIQLFQQFISNPAQAYCELGRIEARVSSPPSRTQTTQAPGPPPTLSGRAATQSFDPEKSTMEDFAAHWHAQNKARFVAK
jgi:hypothetical protein